MIWLGLDGLDWELLDRLSAEGQDAELDAALVPEGASGRLSSFVPILSPVLWTTAATGVGPDMHRILDFQEVDPKTGQKVPISGRSRAVPAVWNLASAAGLQGRRRRLVGDAPGRAGRGLLRLRPREPDPLREAAALRRRPIRPSLEAGVAQVVARDGEVRAGGARRLSSTLPEGEIAQALSSGVGMENPIVALARILSATRVYQRIARDLYDRNHPDLMALYLEGTDEIGHVFALLRPAAALVRLGRGLPPVLRRRGRLLRARSTGCSASG